jgi:N-hydroxyarylamine O-acetyltransferase
MLDDEWTVDVLDLDAYLSRLNYTGPTDVSPAALAALHRAHVAAIPFENLDVVLGRGISVDLDRIQAKLVHSRRGGYCYEHGLLFAATLQQLGYPVQRLLARVGSDTSRPRPRTHLVLIVGDGTVRWLADVGFGSGLLEPLPLQADAAVTQAGWTYRLMQPAAGSWLLQEYADREWTTLYSVSEEPQHLADVVMSNHYTSTWPDSPFVRGPVVVRKDDREVRRVVGRQLSHTRPGHAVQERQLSDADFGPALQDLGVQLSPAEVGDLVATLPAFTSAG